MSEKPAKIRKPSVRRAFGCDVPEVHLLDIGAMAEGTERYAGMLEQEIARVTGFEPNPEQFRKLIAQRMPRREYLPYFLGDGGTATFYMTGYAGCCSLLEPNPAVIDLFMTMGTKEHDDNYKVVKTAPVQTIRLDDVPGLALADFLKLDIQGSELEVLRNGTRVLSAACVLEVEAEFLPLYKNQPLFGDLQVFLREQGWLLHKLIDVGGRTFRPLQFGENPHEAMSQLLFADAIFVRDFTDLGKWPDEQLLKGAALLYDLYCSHDLALLLLREYDRRRGTQVTASLTQALQGLTAIPAMYLNQKLWA